MTSSPVQLVTSVAPFSKNLRLEVIILEKRETVETSDRRRVCQCLVADGSGSIQLALWDRQIDALEVADIILITGGSAALHKDQLSVYCSSGGSITRIGSFTKVFSETPNVSTWTWRKDPVSKQFTRVA